MKRLSLCLVLVIGAICTVASADPVPPEVSNFCYTDCSQCMLQGCFTCDVDPYNTSCMACWCPWQ